MTVSVQKRDKVAHLVFHRPPNNHVSVELIRDLADALDALDEDAACRAIVLTSVGKNFCAGADLANPGGITGGDGRGILEFYDQAARLFAARKPIVAAVQGAAVGAGLGLALAADHRVAAKDARFVANFTALGFYPGFGLTHTLPRLIGPTRASLMFLTSRRIRAEEALAWGLADAVAEVDAVVDAAHALAAEIAANAPLSIEATRATLRSDLAAAVRAQTREEFAIQNRLRQTADYAEGVRAVSERRAGDFKGR